MKNSKNKLLIGLLLIGVGLFLFVLIAVLAVMGAEFDEATNTRIIDDEFVLLVFVPIGMIVGGVMCLKELATEKAAQKPTEKLAKKPNNRTIVRTQATEIEANLKRILNISHPSEYLLSEDHALFSGSSCCPLCSLYNLRIFSVSGKDKRFPPLVSLPDEIHDGKCDVCQCYYSLSVWFEGVNSPDIVTAIQKSNAPLVDKRTAEQKQHFEERQAKATRKKIK